LRFLVLAARNAWRHPLRTALTAAEVAVAVLAFVLLRSAVDAWHAGADLASGDRIVTRNRVSFTLVLPRRYADRIREVDGVRAATFASWFNGRDPRDRRNYFTSLAVDPASYLDVFDEIDLDAEARARWVADRQGAIVGDVLARKLHVRVGDSIVLQGTVYPGDWHFRVDGIYRTQRETAIRNQFLFHWAYLDATVPEWRRGRIGYLVASAQAPARAAELGRAIDARFADEDVRTLTQSERTVHTSLLGLLSALLGALDVVSLVLLAVMMLIVGNTLSMSVRERTPEWAVMRALGFRPRHVAGVILGEAALTAGLGGALGLAAAWPLIALGVGRWLEENLSGFFPYFRIDAVTGFSALGLAIGLGVAAALVPALRAARTPIAAGFRRAGD
jgi:putative ABC transport system permease protein